MLKITITGDLPQQNQKFSPVTQPPSELPGFVDCSKWIHTTEAKNSDKGQRKISINTKVNLIK